MHTETIDLTIGGIEFSQCIVSFEYSRADSGAPDQPAYGEDLTIYRVQLLLNPTIIEGFLTDYWVDLQEQHVCAVEHQVLNWIHAKQEQSKLDKQIEDKGL